MPRTVEVREGGEEWPRFSCVSTTDLLSRLNGFADGPLIIGSSSSSGGSRTVSWNVAPRYPWRTWRTQLLLANDVCFDMHARRPRRYAPWGRRWAEKMGPGGALHHPFDTCRVQTRSVRFPSWGLSLFFRSRWLVSFASFFLRPSFPFFSLFLSPLSKRERERKNKKYIYLLKILKLMTKI